MSEKNAESLDPNSTKPIEQVVKETGVWCLEHPPTEPGLTRREIQGPRKDI